MRNRNLSPGDRKQLISILLDRRFRHGKEWKLEYGSINKVAKYFNVSRLTVQRIRKVEVSQLVA